MFPNFFFVNPSIVPLDRICADSHNLNKAEERREYFEARGMKISFETVENLFSRSPLYNLAVPGISHSHFELRRKNQIYHKHHVNYLLLQC